MRGGVDVAVLLALKSADDAAGIELARVLIERAQPRLLAVRDDNGRTPAHVAAERKESLPLLQRLAARGADLKASDGRGGTVFGQAAFAANPPALRWLAERGALTPGVSGNRPVPTRWRPGPGP